MTEVIERSEAVRSFAVSVTVVAVTVVAVTVVAVTVVAVTVVAVVAVVTVVAIVVIHDAHVGVFVADVVVAEVFVFVTVFVGFAFELTVVVILLLVFLLVFSGIFFAAGGERTSDEHQGGENCNNSVQHNFLQKDFFLNSPAPCTRCAGCGTSFEGVPNTSLQDFKPSPEMGVIQRPSTQDTTFRGYHKQISCQWCVMSRKKLYIGAQRTAKGDPAIRSHATATSQSMGSIGFSVKSVELLSAVGVSFYQGGGVISGSGPAATPMVIPCRSSTICEIFCKENAVAYHPL